MIFLHELFIIFAVIWSVIRTHCMLCNLKNCSSISYSGLYIQDFAYYYWFTSKRPEKLLSREWKNSQYKIRKYSYLFQVYPVKILLIERSIQKNAQY